jgi:hypothetical protein
VYYFLRLSYKSKATIPFCIQLEDILISTYTILVSAYIPFFLQHESYLAAIQPANLALPANLKLLPTRLNHHLDLEPIHARDGKRAERRDRGARDACRETDILLHRSSLPVPTATTCTGLCFCFFFFPALLLFVFLRLPVRARRT